MTTQKHTSFAVWKTNPWGWGWALLQQLGRNYGGFHGGTHPTKDDLRLPPLLVCFQVGWRNQTIDISDSQKDFAVLEFAAGRHTTLAVSMSLEGDDYSSQVVRFFFVHTWGCRSPSERETMAFPRTFFVCFQGTIYGIPFRLASWVRVEVFPDGDVKQHIPINITRHSLDCVDKFARFTLWYCGWRKSCTNW